MQVLEIHSIKAMGPAEQEEAGRRGAAGSEGERRARAGAAGAAGGPQAEGGLQARQQARSQQRCSGCVARVLPAVPQPLCMAETACLFRTARLAADTIAAICAAHNEALQSSESCT